MSKAKLRVALDGLAKTLKSMDDQQRKENGQFGSGSGGSSSSSKEEAGEKKYKEYMNTMAEHHPNEKKRTAAKAELKNISSKEKSVPKSKQEELEKKINPNGSKSAAEVRREMAKAHEEMVFSNPKKSHPGFEEWLKGPAR